MKVICVAAGFLLSCAASASGASYAEMGYGSHGCTQFLSDVASPSTVTETIYFSWAQGYMSALNYSLLARNESTRNLNAEPVAAQEKFVRDYCGAHPDEGYDAAVAGLFTSFPEVQTPAQ
ncbi:MAG TPA: hypothetical protein VGG48_13970 [Rhizomicrobium sp.]|jgi:hypothetical protein